MKPSTLQQKASALLALDARRKAHHYALSSLHASPLASQEEHEQRGLRMWRRLREIEAKARTACVSYGNGTMSTASLEACVDAAQYEVSRIFGGILPPGFYVETDWREPSLKLEAKYTPEAFPADRAGNGILCGKVSI